MKLLASSLIQFAPPSSERYSPRPFSASTLAYTTCGFEGATATAVRPQGLGGKPLALLSLISVQWSPPSVDLNNPLPEVGLLPERNVHPWRRKSHIEA